jgi:hypothetical protein
MTALSQQPVSQKYNDAQEKTVVTHSSHTMGIELGQIHL